LLFDFTAIFALAAVVLIVIVVFVLYCTIGNKVDAKEKQKREEERQEYLDLLMGEDIFKGGKSRIFRMNEDGEMVEAVDEADLEQAADAVMYQKEAETAEESNLVKDVHPEIMEAGVAAPARKFNVEAAEEAEAEKALHAEVEAALGADTAAEESTLLSTKSDTLVAARKENKAAEMAEAAARVAAELGVEFSLAEESAPEAVNEEITADVLPENAAEETETPADEIANGSGFYFKSDPRLTGKVNEAAAAAVAAATAAEEALAGVGGSGDKNPVETCVVKPEKPLAFGYKMAWLAIPNMQPNEVIERLELDNVRPTNWTGGLTAAYDNTKELFISPQINGWVLVVGKVLWSKIDLDTPAEQNSWLQRMGRRFPELYYFSSMRTLGNYAWLYMRNGEIVRAYGLSSELGEVMWDIGQPTTSELSANIGFVTGNAELMVDEKTVLSVAAGWTISTTFDEGEYTADIGFIGKL